MGVTSYTNEITTAASPVKMFKALFIDSHRYSLLPKLMPEAIKSIEIVDGNGGVGSIEQTNFPHGFSYKYMRQRVETCDKEKLVYKYTVVEGDVLKDPLKSIVNGIKCEPSGNGGCVVKMKPEYHTKGDIGLSEEAVKVAVEHAMGIFKAARAYLLANPEKIIGIYGSMYSHIQNSSQDPRGINPHDQNSSQDLRAFQMNRFDLVSI